jgi:hypothetical protein
MTRDDPLLSSSSRDGLRSNVARRGLTVGTGLVLVSVLGSCAEPPAVTPSSTVADPITNPPAESTAIDRTKAVGGRSFQWPESKAVSNLRISPDRKWIAFDGSDQGFVRQQPFETRTRWTIAPWSDRDGAEVDKSKSIVGKGERRIADPAGSWAHDGRGVAYWARNGSGTGSDDETRSIWLTSVHGESVELAKISGLVDFSPLLWSPGDDRLYWIAGKRRESWRIMSVDLSGELRIEAIPDYSAISARSVSLSPDGAWIAIEDDDSIWLFDVSARSLSQKLTSKRPYIERGLPWGPWTEPQWNRASTRVLCIVANRAFILDPKALGCPQLETNGEVVGAIWLDDDSGPFVVTGRHEDAPLRDAQKILSLRTEFDRGQWRFFGEAFDGHGVLADGGAVFSGLAEDPKAEMTSWGKENFGVIPWALNVFVLQRRD